MRTLFHRLFACFSRRSGLVVLLLIVALGWRLWHHRSSDSHDLTAVSHGVVTGHPHVGDGDGLTFDGARVRLLGIDAPELAQSCDAASGGRHACGEEARSHLADLIGGNTVTCSWSRLDRYGRRLGECRAGDLDLNAAMVRDGWALAYGAHGEEEAEARAARRGVWSGGFVRPQDWRREHLRPYGWWQSWFGD